MRMETAPVFTHLLFAVSRILALRILPLSI
jgi:hypothetical protein